MSRLITIISGLMTAATVLGQKPIELDLSCAVTVGNQTAIVRPDGSFLPRNISVFRSRTTVIAPQFYRVRATCVSNGQTMTGQSEFFELKPGADDVRSGRTSQGAGAIPVGTCASASARNGREGWLYLKSISSECDDASAWTV